MIELITKAEAARMLTVSEDTLDRLIRAGMLPVYRISAGITRLDREDVAAYMESRRQRATAIGRKSNKVKMVPEVYRGGKNNSGYVPGMKVV
ncbi:MAG: helix-turn-helix domain-containing protein [Oscillospiraceae bacterium]|jgi:excisionase family DNA binding protein|nr:helix-turn-helix domain-containing protein [Oscillospiraceae bacterium]